MEQQEIPAAAFPRRKALHLFKLIILQPGYQLHRDQVLEVLWSHLSVDSATAQLYKSIHYVRQALATVDLPQSPDTLFELQQEVIRLSIPDGIQTDVATFEHLAKEAIRTGDLSLLQQAAACYSGDLLPMDRYEEWTLSHRAKLQEQYNDVLVKLGQHYLNANNLVEAVDVFRQALNNDKLREDCYRGLMMAFALQGSRTRALRQYHRCREILSDELDTNPAAETTDLYQEILGDQIQPISLTQSLPQRESPQLAQLIGRRSERQVLEQHLDRLSQGQGAVLGLVGKAGIGKTRLAQEFFTMAPQDWMVLWGSNHEQEGRGPYMPFIEALRKAVRLDPCDAHLIPAEFAVAIPELPADVTPVETADRIAAQQALFAGVQRFLAAKTEHAPVILILDNLHVADSGTLKLFHYIARQAPSMKLLLVGIWRLDEPAAAPDFEKIIGNLDQEALLRRLTLQPLAEGAHQQLLEQTLEGDSINPSVAAQLYELSVGNPLFATEMIRQLAAEKRIVLVENEWQLIPESEKDSTLEITQVSSSVQALVRNRLDKLSSAGLRMLQFAAVAGQNIPVPLLEEWALVGEHRVMEPTFLDVLDNAVQAGLLHERGFGYHFAHPLFRQAIYQQMSKVRQRALHRQVASGLERAFHDDPSTLPVESVAFHYLHAGDVEQAVDYLIQAGDRAEAVYDHDSALRRYQEALSLLEARRLAAHQQHRAKLYERIGDVYRAIGNVADSLEAYRQVFNVMIANKASLPKSIAHELHRKITHTAVLKPDMLTAADHLEQAWALLTGNGVEKARLLITQALFDWHANQLEAAIQHASEALAIAERQGATVEASQACEMLAMAHLPLGNWEKGLQYELRRQIPGWTPEIAVAVDAHLCLYQFRLQGHESYQRVKKFIEHVREQASTIGALRCLAVCHHVLGSLAVLQAQPEIAREHLAESLTLHQRIGSPSSAAYTLARQTDLLTVAGNPQGGWECVQKGLAMAEQAAVRDHSIMLIHTAGIWNRLAVSDLASAAELVEIAEQHDAQVTTCVVCSVDRYVAMAAYYVAVDDFEKAGQYVTQALRLSDQGHNRLGRARALRVKGQIHVARGELSQAETCLSEAAAIFSDLDDLFDLARTLQIYESFPAESRMSSDERQSRVQMARHLFDQYQMNS